MEDKTTTALVDILAHARPTDYLSNDYKNIYFEKFFNENTSLGVIDRKNLLQQMKETAQFESQYTFNQLHICLQVGFQDMISGFGAKHILSKNDHYLLFDEWAQKSSLTNNVCSSLILSITTLFKNLKFTDDADNCNLVIAYNTANNTFVFTMKLPFVLDEMLTHVLFTGHLEEDSVCCRLCMGTIYPITTAKCNKLACGTDAGRKYTIIYPSNSHHTTKVYRPKAAQPKKENINPTFNHPPYNNIPCISGNTFSAVKTILDNCKHVNSPCSTMDQPSKYTETRAVHTNTPGFPSSQKIKKEPPAALITLFNEAKKIYTRSIETTDNLDTFIEVIEKTASKAKLVFLKTHELFMHIKKNTPSAQNNIDPEEIRKHYLQFRHSLEKKVELHTAYYNSYEIIAGEYASIHTSLTKYMSITVGAKDKNSLLGNDFSLDEHTAGINTLINSAHILYPLNAIITLAKCMLYNKQNIENSLRISKDKMSEIKNGLIAIKCTFIQIANIYMKKIINGEKIYPDNGYRNIINMINEYRDEFSGSAELKLKSNNIGENVITDFNKNFKIFDALDHSTPSISKML